MKKVEKEKMHILTSPLVSLKNSLYNTFPFANSCQDFILLTFSNMFPEIYQKTKLIIPFIISGIIPRHLKLNPEKKFN